MILAAFKDLMSCFFLANNAFYKGKIDRITTLW